MAIDAAMESTIMEIHQPTLIFVMSKTPNRMLVIVHPGSACGSADMNIGRYNADYLRAEMTGLILSWDGGVVVIDSDLSDELNETWRRSYRELGEAIEQAVERAQTQGKLALRVVANDFGEYTQMEAIRDIVQTHQWDPAKLNVTLTGAWVHDDGQGCVHSVREVLEELGFSPRIEDAMDMDFDLDASPEEEEEEEELPTPSVPPSRRRRIR